MMALLCPGCDRPLRDVTHLYLSAVREYQRGCSAEIVYLCVGRCKDAWLMVGDYPIRVPRRWVMELDV